MIYDSVRKWICRNARPLEFSLWRFLFENGSQDDVAHLWPMPFLCAFRHET